MLKVYSLAFGRRFRHASAAQSGRNRYRSMLIVKKLGAVLVFLVHNRWRGMGITSIGIRWLGFSLLAALLAAGCGGRKGVAPSVPVNPQALEQTREAANQAETAARDAEQEAATARDAARQAGQSAQRALSRSKTAAVAAERSRKTADEARAHEATVGKLDAVAATLAGEAVDDRTRDLAATAQEAARRTIDSVRGTGAEADRAQAASDKAAAAAARCSSSAEAAVTAATEAEQAAATAKAQAGAANTAAEQELLDPAQVAAQAARSAAAETRAAAQRAADAVRETTAAMRAVEDAVAGAERSDQAARLAATEAGRYLTRVQAAVRQATARNESVREALARATAARDEAAHYRAAAQEAARNARKAATLTEFAPLMAFAASRPGRLEHFTTTMRNRPPPGCSGSDVRSLADQMLALTPDSRASWAEQQTGARLQQAEAFALKAREAAAHARKVAAEARNLAFEDMPPAFQQLIEETAAEAEEANRAAATADQFANRPEEVRIAEVGQHLAAAAADHPQDWTAEDRDAVIQKQLEPAQVLFEPERQMRVNRPDTVQAIIVRALDANLKAKLDNVEKYVTREIEASYRMRMTLKAKEPGTFDIEAIRPADGMQVVTKGRLAPWEWTVTPRREGTLTLLLNVEALVKVEGSDAPVFIDQLEEEIAVQAGPRSESFKAWLSSVRDKVLENLATALAAAIGGLVITMLALFRKRIFPGNGGDER